MDMLVRWEHDERPIYRATGVERDEPWWFASRNPDLPGRFDLPAPDGTCYWADDPVGSLLERHVDPDALDPIVDIADLATSTVWTCVPHGELDAADLTARAAPVTKELSTVTPYDVEGGPWEWADAIAANGWHGLVAWTRLDPAGSRTVALFSEAGAGTPDGWGDPIEMGLGGSWADDLGGFVSRAPGSADIETLDP